MRPKLSTVPRVGYAPDDGALLPFDEAQAYLHTTRNALKLAVARREIEFVRIGRQTLFTRAGLQRFIARRTAVPLER
jgi:excisionase family DNA binding protein